LAETAGIRRRRARNLARASAARCTARRRATITQPHAAASASNAAIERASTSMSASLRRGAALPWRGTLVLIAGIVTRAASQREPHM